MASTRAGKTTISVRDRMISRGWTPRIGSGDSTDRGPRPGTETTEGSGMTDGGTTTPVKTTKKKDNTMLIVGAAAIGLLMMMKK